MTVLKYEKEIVALLVIDPYNDLISEVGKFWDHLKTVAEANNCVPNMLRVLNAARAAKRNKLNLQVEFTRLLTSASLFGDPVVYITGTMDERDAFRLTFCEEANDIHVDQTNFVQVERDSRPPGLYLSFQFIYMLPSHAANQP